MNNQFNKPSPEDPSGRETQVSSQLGSLSRATVENSELVSEIANALSRVTRDDQPTEANKEPVVPCLVALACDMRDIAKRIENTNANLRGLLGRIEV